MSAQDYPITFAYGAQDGKYYGPNGSIGEFHKGDDRGCPTGTPIVIGGVTIGETGGTGAVSAPHLHIQEWQGSTANTRKPRNSFKGGTVTGVGTGTQWGKFVTITLDGWNTTYCHLSSQNVSNGTIIKGGSDVADEADVRAIYKYGPLGRDADAAGVKHYVGKKTDFIINDHLNSTEGKARAAALTAEHNAATKVPSLEQTVQTLRSDLSSKNKEIEVLGQQIEALRDEALEDEEVIKIAEGKVVAAEGKAAAWEKEVAAARKLIEQTKPVTIFDTPHDWSGLIRITNTFIKEKVKAWLGK